MSSGIDDFHEAHFVVHYELFSVCVLYCWIIGLEIGVNCWTKEGRAAGERTDLWTSERGNGRDRQHLAETRGKILSVAHQRSN